MPAADVSRIALVAQQDADLLDVPSDISMLDERQAAVVYQLVRLAYRGEGRIVELGAYIGGTTRIFGEALTRLGVRDRRLEVYDLFEHNAASRTKLAGHPDFEESTFLPIWRSNTERYADLIHLCVGDLRETADHRSTDIEVLYVDIVKHPSVIAPVVQKFVRRMRPGSLLIHQDYFHWQSPWVVTSTERLMAYFDIVGSVSNHMLVLQLREPIPPAMMAVDDATLPPVELETLMRSAIARYPGIRSGLLRVSMLNLLQNVDGFDFDLEVGGIRREFDAAPWGKRVIKYLDAVVGERNRSTERPMW